MSYNEKHRMRFRENKRDKNKVGNYLLGKTLEEITPNIKMREGKNIVTGEKVLIKIIDKSYLYENEKNLNNLATEISILKILHHKNLVHLYELREMTTNLYIITEYCENGSLFNYVNNKNNSHLHDSNKLPQSTTITKNIKNFELNKSDFNSYNSEDAMLNKESTNLGKVEAGNYGSNTSLTCTYINSNPVNPNINSNTKAYSEDSFNYSGSKLNQELNASKTFKSNKVGYLQESEACKLFQDIIDGVEYLHSQYICNRDLTPHNLYLDYKNNLKICNMSFSKTYENDKLLKTPIGTLQFAAPEVLLGKSYHGLFSDVWSCGVILYFMLTGNFPFNDESDEATLLKIKEGKYEVPENISAQAQDLIKKILNKNCLERFDLIQIKQHPWFNLVKPKLNKGININLVSIPVDEKIIFKLENLEYDIETLKSKIKDNIHDDSTAVYYLFLKNQIKNGHKSIADLESQLFIEYVNNPKNFIKNIEFIQKEKRLLAEQENMFLKNNFFRPDSINNNYIYNKNSQAENDALAENVESSTNEEVVTIFREEYGKKFSFRPCDYNEDHLSAVDDIRNIQDNEGSNVVDNYKNKINYTSNPVLLIEDGKKEVTKSIFTPKDAIDDPQCLISSNHNDIENNNNINGQENLDNISEVDECNKTKNDEIENKVKKIQKHSCFQRNSCIENLRDSVKGKKKSPIIF